MSPFPITRRELRLGSGLVMFGYIAVHFIDHALGLWSLAVAERALAWSVAVWHSRAGSVLLYGAAAIHVGLAFLAVYERRTLRMPPAQALRIALGIGMPVMLIGHVVATRMAADLHALSPTYTRIVWALWVSDGEGRQLAMQAPGWVHGCMGLHFAFGRRAAWQRLRPALFGAALLLPVLAGLGFLSMGRELAALALDPAWRRAAEMASSAQGIAIGRLRDSMLGGYFVLIGAVFAARELRAWIERRRKLLVPICYPQRTVQVPRGWSVLEASRAFGIAHLSMCGGNARCSTCRVRVLEGAQHLPPPSADEQRTLHRIGAVDDVRLACRLRPSERVVLEPVLDPQTAQVCASELSAAAVERDVALLFIKLSGWTSRDSRMRSPHDTVYALNRVLDAVWQAVSAAGGQAGRFDNEGASATFGIEDEIEDAARQALAAAAAVEAELTRLNAQLMHEVGLAAEFVMALHVGHAAIGSVGRSGDRTRLPVGEVVRVGRALREHAVAVQARFVISRAAAEAAHGVAEGDTWQPVAMPGGDTAVEAMVLARVPGVAR